MQFQAGSCLHHAPKSEIDVRCQIHNPFQLQPCLWITKTRSALPPQKKRREQGAWLLNLKEKTHAIEI